MRSFAFASLILPCLASAGSPASVPPAIAARIASDEAGCVGGAPRFEKGFLTRKDVNGDGVPDYVLDYNHLFCGSMQGFCGSGGCGEVVFASRNGRFVKVIDDLVERIIFKKIDGRPAAIFVKAGLSCGKSDNSKVCYETRVWNGSTFVRTR